VLFSNSHPNKAILLAHPDLFAPMIDVEIGTNSYELHDIRIDGNRYNRTRTQDCAYPNGSNMLAKGQDFRIVGVESIRAMCGSGMEVYTNDLNTGFEIYNSTFFDNGWEAGSTPNNAVSDGLTLGRCGTGYVHDNWFYDNSDIDLVLFTGPNCGIARNIISHTFKYGYAGMQVSGADINGAGDNTGSQYWSNQISSNPDLLSFGIVVGNHPWDGGATMSPNAGTLFNNSVSGAMINLAVDGILAGTITNNSLSNPQGSRGFNGCTVVANYTAGHFGSASLDGGFTPLVFDPAPCGAP
jgi:hypothetical protein